MGYTQKDISNNEINKFLIAYDFDSAKKLISNLSNQKEKAHYKTLLQILYNQGSNKYKDSTLLYKQLNKNALLNPAIIEISKAFYFLNYKRRDTSTYKILHDTYLLAKTTKKSNIEKLSLLAILNFYARENTLNEKSFLDYLNIYKDKSETISDTAWVVSFKNLFEGRNVKGTNKKYAASSRISLKYYKNHETNLSIGIKSSLLENIGTFYTSQEINDSAKFYLKKLLQKPDLPYLRENKFIANLDMGRAFSQEKKYDSARVYFQKAKKKINIEDPIKGELSFSKFKAFYLHSKTKEHDSAYIYLNNAYTLNKYLNSEENNSKISQQKIVLDTAEKEKENLKLKADNLEIENKRKQNRNLLFGSLGLILFGGITFILIQKNTKRKQLIAEQEKELQTQKLATVLKEQELTSIDAMIEGQEKERQRIANDLHDDLGGLMATVKLHFNALKEKQSPELYKKTDKLLDEAYHKIRSVAHTKNSGVMAKKGLLKAINDMAKTISASNKLQIDVIDHGLEHRLENSLELTIFRIIQELITNIIKHAEATEATIHITNHDDSLNIMVEDNGKGFNPKTISKNAGMGIHSIDKRIENLGGTVTIESEHNKGTTVIIDIPS